MKVKIYVAVDTEGEWIAAGWPVLAGEEYTYTPKESVAENLDSAEPYVIHEVEVNIPVPKMMRLKGKVVKTETDRQWGSHS